MKNLQYATAVNDRHNITSTTWQDNGVWYAKFTVDGVMLAHESLGPVEES